MIKVNKRGVKIKSNFKEINDDMMILCKSLVLTIGRENTSKILEKGLRIVNPKNLDDVLSQIKNK